MKLPALKTLLPYMALLAVAVLMAIPLFDIGFNTSDDFQYYVTAQQSWDYWAMDHYYYAITGKVPPQAIERLDNDELIRPSELGVPLGDAAEEMHREVGRYLAEQRAADRLFVLGSLGRFLAEGAVDAGFPEENISCFEDREELGAELERFAGEGDAVLFTNIQMPGKKAMDVSAFLLGNKIEIGTVLL